MDLGEKGTERKKNKWEKTFHSLHVPPLMHTCATAAPECGHFKQTSEYVDEIIWPPQEMWRNSFEMIWCCGCWGNKQ